MTLYKVECEYDMGWNVDSNTAVYSNYGDLIEVLELKDWDECGYSHYEELIHDGLLSITEYEG